MFREGLLFKSHRVFYHSTPGSRVIIKNKEHVEGHAEASRGRGCDGIGRALNSHAHGFAQPDCEFRASGLSQASGAGFAAEAFHGCIGVHSRPGV